MIILKCDALDTVKAVNQYFLQAMQTYQVPIVGYAIINNWQIESAQIISLNPNILVTRDSLFQAASISKSLSAYGALKLVAKQQLNLDASVNQPLQSWQIKTNDYNKDQPITLRMILDMTSGLTVSGFEGYKQGTVMPKLIQILEGENPAKNHPVRVFYKPGSQYFYSGGGYQVLQQLIQDITKTPFEQWMQTQVLKPLQMSNSVFKCPLEGAPRVQAVPAFDNVGNILDQGWYNYPLSAAAGLWSTPTDLAKFAISVSNDYLGKADGFIPEKLARQMLTRQPNTSFGLGVVVTGQGLSLNFRKAGHNTGYHSELIMFPNIGKGLVIMTDSENGLQVIQYMIPIIARFHHWPYFFPFYDELIKIP